MYFKPCSLISETEIGFAGSIEELGYCFCIWIKIAFQRLKSAIYNKKVQEVIQYKAKVQCKV